MRSVCIFFASMVMVVSCGPNRQETGSTASAKGGAEATGGAVSGGAMAAGGNLATGGAVATGGRSGGRRSTGGQPATGGRSATGGTSTGGADSGGTSTGGILATGGNWSTEFCKNGSDHARIDQSPGASFYIGGWTHSIEPMGSGRIGNDYPFIIECKETVDSSRQLLMMISGNIGYDSGPGFWFYNQNITTNTGDYNTILAHAGQYGYPKDFPDEAGVRGWVYVGWHYRPSSSGTQVSQYLKFGVDGPVILVEDVIDGTGGWSKPKPDPINEPATPVAINVGGGPRGCEDIYMQYAKVYVMKDAPSKAEVDAIALRTTPDTEAWADWPLLGGDLRDVSGNDRALAPSVDRSGKSAVFPPAIAGPAF